MVTKVGTVKIEFRHLRFLLLSFSNSPSARLYVSNAYTIIPTNIRELLLAGAF